MKKETFLYGSVTVQHMVFYKEVYAEQRALWNAFSATGRKYSPELQARLKLHMKTVATVLHQNIDTIADIVTRIDWKTKQSVIKDLREQNKNIIQWLDSWEPLVA